MRILIPITPTAVTIALAFLVPPKGTFSYACFFIAIFISFITWIAYAASHFEKKVDEAHAEVMNILNNEKKD